MSTTNSSSETTTEKPNNTTASSEQQQQQQQQQASFNINAKSFAPVAHYRSYCFPPGVQEELNKRHITKQLNTTSADDSSSGSNAKQQQQQHHHHHQPHQQPSPITPLSYYFEKTLVNQNDKGMIMSTTTATTTGTSTTTPTSTSTTSTGGKNNGKHNHHHHHHDHLTAIQWSVNQMQTESPKICHDFLHLFNNQCSSSSSDSNTEQQQPAFSEDIPVGYLFSKENWLDGGNISGTDTRSITVPFKRVLSLPGLVFSLPFTSSEMEEDTKTSSSSPSPSCRFETEWKKLLPLLTSPTYNFVAFGFFIWRDHPYIFSVFSHSHENSVNQRTCPPINTSPFMEELCVGARATYCPEGIIPLVVSHNQYRPRSVCVALVSEHEQRLATAPIVTIGKPANKNDAPSELLDVISRSPDHARNVGPTDIRLMQLTATIDDVATSLIVSTPNSSNKDPNDTKQQQLRIGPSVPPEARTKPAEQYIVGLLPAAHLMILPAQHNHSHLHLSPSDYLRTCIVIEVVVPQLGASAPSANHFLQQNHHNHNHHLHSNNSNHTASPSSPASSTTTTTTSDSTTPSASSSAPAKKDTTTTTFNHHHHSQFSTHYKLQTQPVHEAVRHILEVLHCAACSPTTVFDIRMRQRIPVFENANSVFLRPVIAQGCLDMWSYASGFVPQNILGVLQQQHYQKLQDQVQKQQHHHHPNRHIMQQQLQQLQQQHPFVPPSCSEALRVKDSTSMTPTAAFAFDWFKIESLREHVSLWRMISSLYSDDTNINSNNKPPERTLFPPSHRHRLTSSRFQECIKQFSSSNNNYNNDKFLARRYACGPRIFLIIRKRKQEQSSCTDGNNSSGGCLDFFISDATMRLATRIPIDSWNLPDTTDTANTDDADSSTTTTTISVLEATLCSTIRPSQMKIVVHDVVMWKNKLVSTALKYQERMGLIESHIEHEERYSLPSPDPVVIVRCAAAPLSSAISTLLFNHDRHQCAVDYDFRGLCLFSTDAVKEAFEQPLTYVWVPPESANCVFAISEVFSVRNKSNDDNKSENNENKSGEENKTEDKTTLGTADLLPPGKKSSHTIDGVLAGASTRLCRVNLFTAPATPALSRHAPATISFHGEYTEFYEDEILSERLVSSDLVVTLLQRSDDGGHWWELMRTMKQAELADVAYSPFSLLGATLRHGVVEGSSGFSHPAMASYNKSEQNAAARAVVDHHHASHHQHQEQTPCTSSPEATTTPLEENSHHHDSSSSPVSDDTSSSTQQQQQLEESGGEEGQEEVEGEGPVVTPITICSLTPRAEVENAISDPLLSLNELAFALVAGEYYRCHKCGTIDDHGRPYHHHDTNTTASDNNNKSFFLCSSCWAFDKNKGTCMSCGVGDFVDGFSDLRDDSDNTNSSDDGVDLQRARFFCKKCWKRRYEARPPYAVVQACEPLAWVPTLLASHLPASVKGFHHHHNTEDSSCSSSQQQQEIFQRRSQKSILRACFKVAKRKQCVNLATRTRCNVICELFARKDEPTIAFWSETVAQSYSTASSNNNNNDQQQSSSSSLIYSNNDILYMVAPLSEKDEESVSNICCKFEESQYQHNFEYRVVPVNNSSSPLCIKEKDVNSSSFWNEEIPLTIDDWKMDYSPKTFGNISVMLLSNQPGYLQKMIEISNKGNNNGNNTTTTKKILSNLFSHAADALAPNGLVTFTVIDPNFISSSAENNNNKLKVTWSSPSAEKGGDDPRYFTIEPSLDLLQHHQHDVHQQKKKSNKTNKTKKSSGDDGDECDDETSASSSSSSSTTDDDQDDEDIKNMENPSVEFLKILNDEKSVEHFSDIFPSVSTSSSSNTFLHISQQQISEAATDSSSSRQKFFTLHSLTNYLDLAKECLGDNMILLSDKDDNNDQATKNNSNNTSSSSSSLLFPTVRLTPEAQQLLNSIVVYTYQRCGRDEKFRKAEIEEEARLKKEAQEKKKQQKAAAKMMMNATANPFVSKNTSGAAATEKPSSPPEIIATLSTTSATAAAAATPGKYVPPSKRGGGATATSSSSKDNKKK